MLCPRTPPDLVPGTNPDCRGLRNRDRPVEPWTGRDPRERHCRGLLYGMDGEGEWGSRTGSVIIRRKLVGRCIIGG